MSDRRGNGAEQATVGVRRRDRILTRLIGLQAAIGGALLVAIILMAVSITGLRNASRDLVDVDRLTQDAHRVQALVIDTQTALRGYLLTDNEAYLAPMEAAADALPPAARRLDANTTGGQRTRRLVQDIARRGIAYQRDYAVPLLELARQDRDRAVRQMAEGRGQRDLVALREQVGQLSVIGEELQLERSRAEARRSDRALIVALLVAVLMIGAAALQVFYLRRNLTRPITAVTAAAGRIGAGDLTVRVPVRRVDEIGHLGIAFNRMAQRLLDTRDEIEQQRDMLGNQNQALAAQAEALASQSAELARQGTQLEQSTTELRAMSNRASFIAETLEAMAASTVVKGRADTLLAALCRRSDATAGTVYSVGHDDDASPALVSSLGVDTELLPERLTGKEGAQAEALRTASTVIAGPSGAGDRLAAAATDSAALGELHLPLVARGVVIGVASIARDAGRPFESDEVDLLEHLAEQAAVTFDNAIQSERARWHADVVRSVLDASQDAITLMAPDGRTLLVNPEMVRFSVDVLGTRGSDDDRPTTEIVHEMAARTADPEAYLANFAKMIEDPDFAESAEYQFVDTGRWVFRHTAPVYSADGAHLGRIIVMRETTKQRELDRVKDELMATVSHELRTPLSAILGFSELLRAREYPEDERREYIATVHEQARRLSELIDDFLDLQRLEYTAGRIERRPVDVAKLARDESVLLGAQSDRHSVTVETHADTVVTADAARIRRALGNLLTNAVKYSPEGGRVVVSLGGNHAELRVAVTDEGIGIPQDAQSKVFDRFFRVDSSATATIGGTGLGLALVREIAEAHGGSVGLESTEGQGTTVWFTLPRTP